MGSASQGPKLRSKTQPSRPRPKTIHIDSGGADAHDGMLTASRGKKGSSSNLSGRLSVSFIGFNANIYFCGYFKLNGKRLFVLFNFHCYCVI